jgi:alpha-L-glutamate ligase-like protein
MATKPSHILGMNGRNAYTKQNSAKAKHYGFSKLRTKDLLITNDIPTAELYHTFDNIEDLENVNWETIPVPFVIKPASGSAGKGIWVIDGKVQDQLMWINNDKKKISIDELNLHISNILDGEFSTWGKQHRAIIEEKVTAHPTLAKHSYQGTPDIRVIVFNSVPVMAMLRLPTKESTGRANLDKGAYGVGIDMATGITTSAIKGKNDIVTHFDQSNRKVNGILIPQWNKVLEIAAESALAAGYHFMGADIFISAEHGPMIVELNGFPGLSIQMANRAGLKRRLQRVEGLEVRDAQHGVKIAKALFAEHFADQIKVDEGLVIIPTRPDVTVYGDQKQKQSVPALVNTGRNRSAISEDLAEQLGLVDLEDLLWRQQEGIEGKVPVVEVTYILKGHKIKTAMVVTKRLNRTKYKVEIGRKDSQGFLIGAEE